MKISRSLVIASGLVLALSMVFAQGGQRQGGAQGGFQGGRQGGGLGFRGAGPRLLLNEAVQKELKMTKSQIEKAQAAFGRPGGQGGPGAAQGGQRGQGGVQGGAQRGQGGAQGGQGGRAGAAAGPGGLSEQEREKRRLEMEKQVKSILDARQFARYNQIVLQAQGAFALTRPDVAAQVGLTTQQVSKIQEIQRQQLEAIRSQLQSMRGQGGAQGGQGGAQRGQGGAQGGAGMREQFQKMRQEIEKKILAVLNPTQKQKWEAMLGPKFNFQ